MRARPRVEGKFLWSGKEKFYVRGVTYGTFATNADREPFPGPDEVRRDFTRMASAHVNAIRTYDVPPEWLLDLAAEHGLRVMVGLPWEEHITFLDDTARMQSIEDRVVAGVRACAGHQAVLCYVVGNEIPAPIVRWHGPRKIERFIYRLYHAAKREDPGALVTYTNYPSTEYLDLPFIDFVSFNIFLETEARLEAYLARLQNLAGSRPLVVAELGLDSRRNGRDTQAASVRWQLNTAYRMGCAGAVVFSWSDRWYRSGVEVDDWDFGLIDRDGREKPAAAAVKSVFAKAPFGRDIVWPRASVVVCTHNGASHLGRCLEGVTQLDYPDYEVIVVDDGSTDSSARIAEGFDVRVIETAHRGLSSARNSGLDAARGEIVAYIDDDAWPDPDWLSYLALGIQAGHVGVGGPNLPPQDQEMLAECVSRAPGAPIHVLISDWEAEHLPGCNMAFRADALRAIGGFDPQFWVAGDDVDICWRLNAMGGTLGFCPGAMVWHSRRASVRSYLKQQVGYGKAEALLERKWPERYTCAGHMSWAGRVYTDGTGFKKGGRRRINYGVWGTGLFQSVEEKPTSVLASLPLMPQMYLVLVALAVLTSISETWNQAPLKLPWFGLPDSAFVLAVGVGFLVVQALRAGWKAFPAGTSESNLIAYRLTTGLLFLLQPIVRVFGRIRNGLTPWRRRGHVRFALPWSHTRALWSERPQTQSGLLTWLETDLRRNKVDIRRGGPFDRWDLEAKFGKVASARLRLTIEEHGHGRQLIRFCVWPCYTVFGVSLLLMVETMLAVSLLFDRSSTASVMLGALVAIAGAGIVASAAAAVGAQVQGLAVLANGISDFGTPDTSKSLARTLMPRAAMPVSVPPFGPWLGSEALTEAHE